MHVISTEVDFATPNGTEDWREGPLAISKAGNFYVRAAWFVEPEGSEHGSLNLWFEVSVNDWLSIRDREFVPELIEGRLATELPGLEPGVRLNLDPFEGRPDDAAVIGHVEDVRANTAVLDALRAA